MKVAQLITGAPSFGGAQAHVRDLAIALRALGHDCTVLVGPPSGLFGRQLSSENIPVELLTSLLKPLHPLRDAHALQQTLAALARFKPDLIAAHTAKAGFLGRLAARKLNIPCVFTPHGFSIVDRQTGKQKQLFVALEKMAAHFGGRVITVCHNERDLVAQSKILPPEQIAVVHNGIPDCSLQADPGRSPVVITMIARFDRQKDHLTLLRALYEIRDEPWRLQLVGVGPLLPSIHAAAAEWSLSNRIDFLSECANTSEILASSQIFVLASNWEAFPISILEAMRAGLPVVASSIGGIAEAVQHETTGFLVPPADPSSLAARLHTLIRRPALRVELGTNSRLRYLRHFTVQKMVEATLRVYQETSTGLLSKVAERAASAASA